MTTWRPFILAIERCSRVAVLDLAEVGEPDEAAAGQRDLRLRQLVGVLGVAEHAHRLLGAGDLGAAAGAVHVALAKLLVDLRGGDALRLQRRGIEDDADRRGRRRRRADTAAMPGKPSRRLATVLSMYQLSCSSVMSVVCAPT